MSDKLSFVEETDSWKCGDESAAARLPAPGIRPVVALVGGDWSPPTFAKLRICGRDRSRPAKALTGQRAPKLSQQNQSISLTIGVVFVSYSGHFNSNQFLALIVFRLSPT
jgi:hypothetical protein